jgi:hypothetical protein
VKHAEPMTRQGMRSSGWLGSLGLKLSRIVRDSSTARVIRGSWFIGCRMGFGDSALAPVATSASVLLCDGGFSGGSRPMFEALARLLGVARSLGDDAQLADTDRGGVFTIVGCIGKEAEEEDRDEAGDWEGG